MIGRCGGGKYVDLVQYCLIFLVIKEKSCTTHIQRGR